MGLALDDLNRYSYLSEYHLMVLWVFSRFWTYFGFFLMLHVLVLISVMENALLFKQWRIWLILLVADVLLAYIIKLAVLYFAYLGHKQRAKRMKDRDHDRGILV